MSDALLLRMSRKLEDQFFYEKDLILSRELEKLKKESESIEALSKVSGITDASVLKELVAHNVRPETLAALCCVPIIETAWADGAIDDKEMKTLLESTGKYGVARDLPLIQEWLRTKPDAKFMDAWKAYMRGLAGEISDASLRSFTADLLRHVRDIAKASGGLLGLVNQISASEQKVIDELERFFTELTGASSR